MSKRGREYKYGDAMKTLDEMGIKGSGEPGSDGLDQVVKNFLGIVQYSTLMTTGKSRASKPENEPLGNRFFTRITGARCKDIETGIEHDRFLFVDNIPYENSLGFQGLVPGIIQNFGAMDVGKMFKAFSSPSKPNCVAINYANVNRAPQNTDHDKNFITIDQASCHSEGNSHPNSYHVACGDLPKKNSPDINSMFDDARSKCKAKEDEEAAEEEQESFQNFVRNINNFDAYQKVNHKNKLANLHHLSVGVLLLFLFYKLLKRN